MITILIDEFMGKYGTQLQDLGGYILDENGVYRTKRVGKGTDAHDEVVYACRIPIVPTHVYTNIDSGIEKVELTYFKHYQAKQITVNRSVISNKSNIIKLADDGVEINSDNAGELMKYLYNVICLNPIAHSESKSSMGWVGERFVPYCNGIDYDNDDAFKHLYKSICKHGDRDKYVEYVRELRRYSRVLRLAMAASFASPIIEKIGENPFVLMLHGGTGVAKSVSLMVAMSVWGDPSFGKMTRTMDMTANSMMATAAFLNNLPFAGDELQTIKNRWGNYDNLIMKVTEGVDRGRMTFSAVNETKSWKCTFLFTGEEPCTKADSGGGVKNRVIEIECRNKLVENGNETVNFIKENHGLIAEEYIKLLNHTDLKARYTEKFKALLDAYHTTDKQAGAMALLLLADDIASEGIFHDADRMLISEVGKWMFTDSEVDVAERAYAFLCGLISENSANFTGENHTVWGEFENDHSAAYINLKVLNDLLTNAGFDIMACRTKWLSKGYMTGYGNNSGYVTVRKLYGVNTKCVRIVLPKGN